MQQQSKWPWCGDEKRKCILLFLLTLKVYVALVSGLEGGECSN